jgi:hypothetical protein
MFNKSLRRSLRKGLHDKCMALLTSQDTPVGIATRYGFTAEEVGLESR